MADCPRCGSSRFHYELRSAGTKSKTNYYRTGVKDSWFLPAGQKKRSSDRQQKTVGFCPDCGYMTDKPIPVQTNYEPVELSPQTKKVLKICGLVFAALIALGMLVQIIQNAAGLSTVTGQDSSSVWATSFTPLDDFKYFVDGDKVTLTDYRGHDKQINIAPAYELDGKTVLVNSLDGTFALDSVTSVIVPEGVTSLASNTFNSCGIEYLYLPSTLTRFDGWHYFHDVKKLYYGGSDAQWAALYTGERSQLDVEQIECNANVIDLITR